MRSRVGLGLTAIRDGRVAASSLGVAVDRGRRLVYVAGSAGAAFAGAVIALSRLGVTPGSIYSVSWTAAMIFIAVVGGIGTIEGPIVGAVLYWVLLAGRYQFFPTTHRVHPVAVGMTVAPKTGR